MATATLSHVDGNDFAQNPLQICSQENHLHPHTTKIMEVMQDLLILIHDMIGGTAAISEDGYGDEGTSVWKIKSVRAKPIVIVEYPDESDDHLMGQTPSCFGVFTRDRQFNNPGYVMEMCNEVPEILEHTATPETAKENLSLDDKIEPTESTITKCVLKTELPEVLCVLDEAQVGSCREATNLKSSAVGISFRSQLDKDRCEISKTFHNDGPFEECIKTNSSLVIETSEVNLDKIKLVSGISHQPTNVKEEAGLICIDDQVTCEAVQLKNRIETKDKPKDTNSISRGGILPCRFCNKMLSSESRRRDHEHTHLPDKPFSCSFCAKTFKTKHNKDNHEKIHTGEHTLSCSYCDKRFPYKSEKDKHEQKHTGERPFLCSYCGKTFSFKASKIRHERLHEGYVFACSFCGKRFPNEYTKIMHERIHAG